MYSISQLNKQDRKDFDCGQTELNQYIKQLASQHIKHNVSRIFVATLETNPDKVVGYYTLSHAQIDFKRLENLLPKRYPAHYPVPLARIGRFAVDKSIQGQGLGRILLTNALYRCYETSKQIGMTGVIVEAKDYEAQKFYMYNDFIPLEECPLTLVILTKTLKSIFG